MKKAGSGSITQWIFACNCHDKSDIEAHPEHFATCPICKKRVSDGRAGSLTQWVFRNESCTCAVNINRTEKPSVKIDAKSQDLPTETYVEEIELELDPDSFPKDRYKPIAEIGRGAAGIVYLCRDRLLHKKVAVKVLRSVTPDQLMSFQREAKATSKLNHPCVVAIMDFGSTSSGAPYMVMEYAKGINLKQYVDTHGPLPLEQAIATFVQIADALEAAHRRGVFHRDLKSSNVLIVISGQGLIEVRVIDFGVAVVTHATQEPTMLQGITIVGTPAYMSPDQVNGYPYDARSEVYALGCVLFEALTGRVPFEGDTALETIAKHAQDPVPALRDLRSGDFPDKLQTVVEKCLSKDPDLRFQTMSDLGEALESVIYVTVADPIESSKSPPADGFALPIAISLFVLLGLGLLAAYYASTSPTGSTTKASDEPRHLVREPSHDTNFNIFQRSWDEPLRTYSKNGIERTMTSITVYYGDDNDLKALDLNAAPKTVNLESGAYTKAGFQRLKDCGIIQLKLADNVNCNDALHSLANSQIESLSINRCLVDDESFSFVESLRHLKYVNIYSCDRFKGSGWYYLSKSPVNTVRWIPTPDDSHAWQYPSKYLRAVCELPSLKVLSLDGDALNQFNSIALSKSKQLQSLNLSGGVHPLTEKCFSAINEIKTLRKLELPGTMVSTNISALRGLHLHQLKIPWLHFDASMVKALLKLNVDELELGFASGDTKLVRYLSQMKSLLRFVVIGDF